MNINKEIEISISDAIIEKPIRFSVGKYSFSLYPSTLGRMQILKNLYLAMNINTKLLSLNPFAEALRVCRYKQETVCQIIAYSTFNEKRDVMDFKKVSQRAIFFRKKVSVAPSYQKYSFIGEPYTKNNEEFFQMHEEFRYHTLFGWYSKLAGTVALWRRAGSFKLGRS